MTDDTFAKEIILMSMVILFRIILLITYNVYIRIIQHLYLNLYILELEALLGFLIFVICYCYVGVQKLEWYEKAI